MKKLLLLCVAGFFTASLAAQAIPDGNFENWTTTTWGDPQYYNSSNDQDVPQGVAANVTQTKGFHGNYGVMLQTISTSQGAQGAYFINANVSGNGNPQGGIPYAQKPTGIRFYFQYTPSGIDTAAVLVIFKKAGASIDSFLITLPKTITTYTLHSYFPNHSLSVTPDTIIFGAVSSIAIIGKSGRKGNAGSTLVIDSVTFTGVSTQPAEMNGDFENWTTGSELTPPGWYTNYPNVTRTTDAQSGNFALELTTAMTNGQLQVGSASTGYYPNNCSNNCYQQGGFAYTGTMDTLEFAYKYSPSKGDTASVSASFMKDGQMMSGFDTLFYASVTSYTNVKIPFHNGLPADSVIISINSSSHNHDTSNTQYAAYVGSVLKIDNMTFASQKMVLGVNNVTDAGEIKVYPNPARNQINVNLSDISDALEKLAVYDLSGRLMSSQVYSGGVRSVTENIDISSFSSGIYLIEVTTGNGRFYQKVCKE